MKKLFLFHTFVVVVCLCCGSNVGDTLERNSRILNNATIALTHPKLRIVKKDNNKDEYVNGLPTSNSTIIPTRSDIPYYIYTPNGTSVLVYLRDEMTTQQIDKCNYAGDTLVPEATRIAPSTKKYNCHSYAWYMQSTSNQYWMNYPYEYYTDGTYEESDGSVGDIICYFDEYGENLHSGIVTSRVTGVSNEICGDSDLVTVRSKWGAWGLYDHRGDQCPYTSSYGGDAVMVKYYKPRVIDSITLSNPSLNNTQSIHRYYSVLSNSTIMDNYALYLLDVVNTKSYSFEISSSHELDVRLYRKYMQPVSINATNTYENGVYKVSFSEYVSYENYYLRVAYADSSDYGTIHTEVINSHSHSYDSSYFWWNYTKHEATCSCGNFHLEGHAVSANSFILGNQYATCLLCGGPASMGFVGPLSLNDLPKSANGSFILPNGVVVLVDEDYDAYMDGTLVFIYPNIE